MKSEFVFVSVLVFILEFVLVRVLGWVRCLSMGIKESISMSESGSLERFSWSAAGEEVGDGDRDKDDRFGFTVRVSSGTEVNHSVPLHHSSSLHFSTQVSMSSDASEGRSRT